MPGSAFRFRRAVVPIASALIAVGAWPRGARAGDAEGMEIVAATPDGAHYAYFASENGDVRECGLSKVGAADANGAVNKVATAVCTEPDGKLLPFEKWTWPPATPEIAKLRTFDKDAGKMVRIGADEETGLARLEILQGGAWKIVRPVEGPQMPDLTGVLKGNGRTLLRVGFSETLNDWEELWSITDAEVASAPARGAAARQDARDATARMRAHRASGTAVFESPPAGTPKEKWEKRRRHGIATFLHKWEITAVYGPLDAADLRDALWLLAWFDSPPRRYEALRWFGGLRARDAAGAAAVLADLDKDPDARALATFLKTTPDHLRALPQVWGATDESLRALNDEQLAWLHRRAWAEQGYHFRDPAVAAFFVMANYTPMPDKRWRKLTADPAFLKDPDAPLVGAGASQTMAKAGLEAILRAERARHVARPPL